MSDIIHLLPDSVANQIAAGEVIQRPASIVKELVENSLDAGATRIQLIVTDAGKTCIQVIDNGKGMSETDARLSFERHATSKIRVADDLFALTTMGFRGEALASIASVAEVELRTRQAEDELGVSITISGSRIVNAEPIACPVGANFIVKNLFFNVPARRKFLKSDKTELTNILTEFHRIVLAHPEVCFSLSTPSTVLLDLPAGTFRQRIDNVFNKQKFDRSLLHVEVDTPIVQIVGFVGTPESRRKANVPQFFFVNGRYMRHAFFAKAVQTAYERLGPEGEQAPFFLQLVVEPSKIDVNIHPTKTEIKFEDERSIWQILLAAVREALGKFNAIPSIDFDTENKPEIPIFNNSTSDVRQPQIRINPDFNPFDEPVSAAKRHNATSNRGKSGAPYSPAYSFTDAAFSPAEVAGNSQRTPRIDAPVSQDDLFGPLPTMPVVPPTQDEAQLFGPESLTEKYAWDPAAADYLLYRGQYLLTPTDEGLFVIDAHRAHIRILYEEYLAMSAAHTFESQRLLIPELITLDTTQEAVLLSLMDDIENIGFSLSPLGGGTYSILAVPSVVESNSPQQLLQTIIDDANNIAHEAKDELLHSAALTMARRMAIVVGQYLSQEEMRDLAARLFKTSNPNHTPDGKPIHHVASHAAIMASIG